MSVTRRTFLGAAAAAASLAADSANTRINNIPIGLELYSVRSALAADPSATLRKVAAIGYQVVEFFAPYYNWTLDQAKETRKLLDDLGLKCNSTHNNLPAFQPANLQKTIDLNHAIGSRFVVMSSAGRVDTLDDWKRLTQQTLAPALDGFRAAGLRGGYHNHQAEFTALPGGSTRPMDVIAANTPRDFMLQFDIGTCLEVGQDPLAWIKANPGRINSAHLKDWNKERGYKVLFGEGAVPWKAVLEAAASTGGAEYFLIEQEGSDYSEFDTAQRCLDAYKKMFS